MSQHSNNETLVGKSKSAGEVFSSSRKLSVGMKEFISYKKFSQAPQVRQHDEMEGGYKNSKTKLQHQNRATCLSRDCHQYAPGWKKCGKNCRICPYTLPNTKTVVGLASGYKHEIQDTVTCNSKNVIYYWKCTKTNCKDFPNCEYIGQTSRKFKDRLAEHRDYPKRDVLTEPSGEHFTKRGHNVSHLKGLVLEKIRNSDPSIIKAREHFYIRKFDTFHSGLNLES